MLMFRTRLCRERILRGRKKPAQWPVNMAVKLPISIVDDSDYALSKRTDMYLLVIYQKAFGNNTIAGKMVPIDAQIGSSTSYFGTSAGASHPFAARVGIRHKF
ncbi:Outer membrane porin protein 32 precursor [Mycetohabitans rhizoxinica HKI 454]|uniref:Outer membrane porin protein 32 n=1 Tax=Mycetohabitans rhizoxinica (strain DSM 19002 / CIP 109453 / HKI 454) TaxID=882378 RepID=E5ANJ2_MYCRK|nr:Outer membrane porin protein 32 precursor [Mycetohabitans rhizoxinica HKI 454]